MHLSRELQISESELRPESLDALIFACGYEHRATHVADSLTGRVSGKAFVMAFKDRPVLARKGNEKFFEKMGYELVSADGSSAEEIGGVLHRLTETSSKPLRILVDYSCMTRVWYAAVIEYLRKAAYGQCIDVIFAYSPSRFLPPPENAAPNEFMGPLGGFSSLGLPSQEISLVIGLGYECDRAMGLFHFVEAVDTYLFYADPVFERRFLAAVKRNNRDIMGVVGQERIFRYPLGDLQATKGILCSLLRALTARNRVVVAPLGPKPFSLVSLLLSVQLPNCDIWRVSAGEEEVPVDREARGEVLLYSTHWVPDR